MERRKSTRNSMKADFYDISHTDIDSVLQMYFKDEKYCFKSGKDIEVTHYAILKMRTNGTWMVHEAVESSEVEMFNGDELITALIEKIISKQKTRKANLTLAVLVIILLIPLEIFFFIQFGFVVVGDYTLSIIPLGIVLAILLPFAYFMTNRNQRKTDDTLYSTRPDYLQILQKKADAEKNEYTKQRFVKRIERLKDRGTSYT